MFFIHSEKKKTVTWAHLRILPKLLLHSAFSIVCTSSYVAFLSSVFMQSGGCYGNNCKHPVRNNKVAERQASMLMGENVFVHFTTPTVHPVFAV